MHSTDSSDDDEYISSAGDNFHESDLEGGDSTSGYDELEDPHSANLPSYLLKDQRNFDIDDIYEEENKILDYDSDIGRDEIDDIHSTCADAKEIKKK